MTHQHSTVNELEINEETLPADIWKKILGVDWTECTISFFVGYRKFRNKTPYTIYAVLKDAVHDTRFRKFLKRILNVKHKFDKYNFSTPTVDSDVLTIQASTLPMHCVLNSVVNAENMKVADTYEKLINGHFYVIRYKPKNDGDVLYAFRKMDKKYNVTKKNTLSKFLWDSGKLVDIEEKPSFKLDSFFDYIVYADTIFIFNQKNFEYILNIRDEIVKLSKKVITGLGSSGIIENPDELETFVGTNLTKMRGILKIETEGYYKNKLYIQQMFKTIQEKRERWGINLNEDGTKIVVTPNNLTSVVKVLTNSRLTSPINGEEFDAEGKQRVTSKSQS